MDDLDFFDNLHLDPNDTSLSIGQRKMIKIVEGAIRVFVRIGIEQATYAKIAQESHVSRPLIQHYFPSKKQLIEASFKYLRSTFITMDIAELNQKLQQCKSCKEFLLKYISMHFEISAQKNCAYMHIGFLFFHYSGIDSKIKAHNSQCVRKGTQRIKEILDRGIEDGSFNISKDETEKLARMIQILLIGALTSCATETQENLVNIQRDVSDTCLKLLKAKNE